MEYQSDLVFQKWNKDMKGLKPPSSLRPPNFDINNEPFCSNSVCVGSYLDIPDSNFHCNHDNETLEQLLKSSNFYALTQSPSGFETWDTNNPKSFGPLELSYAGYPEITDDNWAVDLSVMDEDLAMEDHTNSQRSLFPSLPAGPLRTPTSFGDCEMDAYVDYGECDV